MHHSYQIHNNRSTTTLSKHSRARGSTQNTILLLISVLLYTVSQIYHYKTHILCYHCNRSSARRYKSHQHLNSIFSCKHSYSYSFHQGQISKLKLDLFLDMICVACHDDIYGTNLTDHVCVFHVQWDRNN